MAATRKVRRLNREIIAAGVVEVGFEDLTVTSLAEHLGVVHASLYRHVANRDELVMVGVDHLMATMVWPEPSSDWRGFLTGRARTLWSMLRDHPGLSSEMAVLEGAPSALRSQQLRAVEHLVALGFTADDAVLAADLVFDLVFDVFIRSAVINLARSTSDTGEEWFTKKLAVVLAGIEAELSPR